MNNHLCKAIKKIILLVAPLLFGINRETVLDLITGSFQVRVCMDIE